MLLPRLLLTAVAVIQATLMLAIELNRTHATHPLWPGHARFHLVWQNLTTALASLFTIALLWAPGRYHRERFFLAAVLIGLPLLGFLLTLAARPLFRGTLADSNGVPPLRVGTRTIDGNTAAVLLGLLTLAVALLLAQ